MTVGPPGQSQRLDARTIEAIADGIEAAGADEAVRCVVARGAGEHFSAGDDLFAAIEATPESWAATSAPSSA